MGYYINPKDTTKEMWLVEHGTALMNVPEWDSLEPDTLPVCLVNNGPFTAAGICYDERELADFADPRDTRGKLWFIVHIDDLEEVLGHTLPGSQ